MWNYKTPGIPDEEFDRTDEVPITKEEVRVIQISKARLSEENIVYDIGCGSGSITIEAALQIGKKGKIYAVDIDPKAVDLTKRNISKFGLTNVDVILSDAKAKIMELPMADAIFIGGTGGDTKDIVNLCNSKLKPGSRIVIGIILIETLYSVLDIVNKIGFSEIDITQVTISKSKKTKTGTMMLARNPVTIISATKT
ncbi:MAG TPA: precorrin-6Y C5,15-methyltransferase (decarboxylating) subunit CbiT [Candidatus Nitrosotenuis sp.]|jgi:cobalt-precorrin-6B (C15)-methyltransferase|nr:precorrin-6Y C5,15-methyltransferase (decarboxylating) subunit CbiT [Candidatus Nitrosotenuis sp.]HIH45730.1 precorrin-6Y C5,15-methyltransferase (decarboxylating) subunit CbiT [Candidatus Nitrosotenuis sp.]HIH68620.1 precorrin-6Y C5,15-methyltransferase (decarboxylating) subunit CbiT [Candidatus Nitrosotenuis sp.]HII04047.1 precorrin-6Y C5,15-methyltransferase (decarboxylating) subunit CbiT [Candidatus Nitrosotenuis sp.]